MLSLHMSIRNGKLPRKNVCHATLIAEEDAEKGAVTYTLTECKEYSMNEQAFFCVILFTPSRSSAATITSFMDSAIKWSGNEFGLLDMAVLRSNYSALSNLGWTNTVSTVTVQF